MRSLNQNGISLIELLCVALLVTGVVVMLSLAFPRASTNILQSQKSAMANNIASAQIESLRSQVYLLTPTTSSNPLFNAACDCLNADWTVLPSTISVIGGTSFAMASCINFVSRSGNSWLPQCSPDVGYKHIVVKVSWNNGLRSFETFQESMISNN